MRLAYTLGAALLLAAVAAGPVHAGDVTGNGRIRTCTAGASAPLSGQEDVKGAGGL